MLLPVLQRNLLKFDWSLNTKVTTPSLKLNCKNVIILIPWPSRWLKPEVPWSLLILRTQITYKYQLLTSSTGQQKGPERGEKRPKDIGTNSQNHDRAHLRFGRDRNNLKLCKILFKNMISLEKITGGAFKLLRMCLRRKNPTRIKNTDKK